MKRQPSKGPSQRQLRVGEQLKHIIAETLQRGDFGTNTAVLTVTEVRPSPDMRQATVYVVSLNDQDIDHVLETLNEHSYFFQKEMGKQMSMKFTPRVRFQADESFGNSQRINQLLNEIDQDK